MGIYAKIKNKYNVIFDLKHYSLSNKILYGLFLMPGIAIGIYFNYIIISALGWNRFLGCMVIVILSCISCSYFDHNLKNRSQ